MGGLASFIGGAGQAAGEYAQQKRAQNFAHQENALKQTQEQYNNLADALERTKASYSAAPDIVNRLNDVEMQIRAAHMPGQPVDPASYQKLLQTYLKAKQEANQAWALHPNNPANRVQGTPAVQKAVAQATGAPEPIPPVGAAATPTPPPFAPQIGQPTGPPAAQPATSPVQPAAQGGGSSSPATFPTAPVQPVAAPGAATGSTGAVPDGREVPVPTLSTSTSGASVAPVVDLDSLLARSKAGYEDTGIMSPQLHEALQHQIGTQAALEQLYRSGGVNLQLGKNKLEAIQPILTDLHDHPENLMQDLMSIETLTGGGGGSAMALGPLLSAMTPQSEPGMTTAGSLEATHPGFLASQGLVGLHPNTPVRVQVNKFTRQPVSAQISSVAEQLKPFGEGVFAYNPREGTLTPQQGVTPIGMLPSQSTLNVPGQLPQTTTTQKVAPGGAAPSSRTPARTDAPAPIPPVGGAGTTTTKPAAKAAAGTVPPVAAPPSGSDVIANNYYDWISGKGGTFSEKEMTAMRTYARAHKLPTPDILSPDGQKAVSDIDPIIEEVKRTQKEFQDSGLADMGLLEGKTVLGAAVKAYQHGITTPYTSLIADLSFASLRSGASAMKNTGSRALPILNKALEHTPRLIDVEHVWDVDQPSSIGTKLGDMLTRLSEGRDAILRNESKGGVIRPVEAPSTGAVAPIALKDGTFLTPHNKAAADKFRLDHADLIK